MPKPALENHGEFVVIITIGCGPPRVLATPAAPYAAASGDGLLVGFISGVAAGAAALGEAVETALVGVCELTGIGARAWPVGDKICRDNTARQTTRVTTSNTLIGVATEAPAGDGVGRVRLNGPSDRLYIRIR